jgi:transcriptional regulator with XRE-family HTH domain
VQSRSTEAGRRKPSSLPGQSIQHRLAANVRRLREARDWTQEETAWRSRLAVRMYQSLEAGTANPTLATVARLCAGFAVDIEDLMVRAPSPAPRRPGRPRRGEVVTPLPSRELKSREPADAGDQRGDLLVIEADDALREALELYLERLGFEVTAAANAEEGLRWIAQEHFDLVLCSDTLPDHSSAWLMAQAPAQRRVDQTMLVIGREPGSAPGPSHTALARPLDLDRLHRAIKSILKIRTRSALRDLPVEQPVVIDLTLYVTNTPASRRALRNLELLLRCYDATRIGLRVFNLDDDPHAGDDADRVVFTPTLIKRAPGGHIWLLGDLHDRSAVIRLLRDAGLEPIR